MNPAYQIKVGNHTLATHSPALIKMGGEDNSPLEMCGMFIGKTPSGEPFQVHSLISRNAVNERLRKSDQWQRQNGYVDANGKTPASLILERK